MSAESFHNIGIHSLVISGVLMLCMALSYAIQRFKIHFMPESLASMIVGLIIGLAAIGMSKEESSFMTFSPSTFFFGLLPPIVLEAAYTMRRRQFFRNIVTILVLAVLGTLLSTIIIGSAFYLVVSSAGLSLTLQECLQMGTLLSCIDTVAVLSLLGSKELDAEPLLYQLVFGESVLNDAVCIALFDSLGRFPSISSQALLDVSLQFAGISLGSLLLGVCVGLLCSACFKRLPNPSQPGAETLLVFLFAYATYCLAEVSSLSGVVALFFCGIVLAHYNWYNISEEARYSTKHGFKALATAAETLVFVYLGVTAAMSFTEQLQYRWSIALVLLAVPICITARVISVFVSCGVANLGRSQRISVPMQTVMSLSPPRGAVSFALALNITGPNRPVLVTTTLTVVVVTIAICGLFSERLIGALGLRRRTSPRMPSLAMRVRSASEEAAGLPPQTYEAQTDQTLSDEELEGDQEAGVHDLDQQIRQPIMGVRRSESEETAASTSTRGGGGYSGIHGLWKRIDRAVLKPLFGGAPTEQS